MSDVMLLGVLRMPIEYVGGPMSPMAQLVSRAREAADRIESDAAEIDRLRAQVAALSAPAPAPAEAVAWLQSYMYRGHTYKRLFLASEFPDMGGRQLAPGVTVVPLYAAPAAPAGWQPIETAPMESGLYLVRIGNQTHVAQFNLRTVSAQWWAAYGSPSRLAQQPTHWMALPAAPGAQGDAS